LKKAEAELTVVIDRGGNVISQFGDMSVMDVTVIAALAAGSFAATKELARRIGGSNSTRSTIKATAATCFHSAAAGLRLRPGSRSGARPS